jgi:hypothetical protein
MGRTSVSFPAGAGRLAGGHQPEIHYADQSLTGQILLDGCVFERCRFERAVLVYRGGTPPTISACAFDGVSFQFQDAAARTLALLQAMSAPSSGLSAIFKASFPRLFGN